MEHKYDKKMFSGDDPFTIFRRWLDEARKTEINDPDAIALATVDEEGMPNVRMVLLRIVEKGSFLFFTNYNSKKGKELFSSNKVAFNVHWKSIRRQIRVRGTVEKEDGQIADNYFFSRPLGSKIGAWASKQSRMLDKRKTLIDRWEVMEEDFGKNVQRPPFWGGFRVIPIEMEFWADGQYRLHDRFVWKINQDQKSWSVSRLYP